MRKRTLAAVAAVTVAGGLALSQPWSGADTHQPPSLEGHAASLRCPTQEPVLEAILEPAGDGVGPDSPEAALDGLLRSKYPNIAETRRDFARIHARTDQVDFAYAPKGGRQFVVLTEKVGDRWNVVGYTACNSLLVRGVPR